MATATQLRRIALSLPGTTEAPHFERTAFKVRRIYATLAPDGRTANLMLTSDQQALKCELAPEAFAPVPNAWGARGATTVKLSAVSMEELRAALTTAWQHAGSKRR
jgi:hypothetical protein